MDIIISIHALLAESDESQQPCERPTTYFYPRSPCGERQPSLYQLYDTYAFLSTLSLRRATSIMFVNLRVVDISIHALLAESDRAPSPPRREF